MQSDKQTGPVFPKMAANSRRFLPISWLVWIFVGEFDVDDLGIAGGFFGRVNGAVGADDADSGFDMSPQAATEMAPETGNQQKESDDIGKDAGGDEEGTGDEDEQSVEEGVGRQFSTADAVLDGLDAPPSLAARQGRPDDPGEDNQSQREEPRGMVGDVEEDRRLDEGNQREKEDQPE